MPGIRVWLVQSARQPWPSGDAGGAAGRSAWLAGQLALAEKAIVVMCADHGVWHEGVTPSPQGVTAIHAGNMVRGNTGVCVLAAQAGARVQVVDVASMPTAAGPD